MMSVSDVFKKSFLDGFSSYDIGTTAAVAVMLTSSLFALYIFVVYRLLTRKTFYSKTFNISLAGITLITAAVILTIQSSIVVSLGMVGALSIVRFRTAIKDSRDTTYIFWAIIVGICCGVGDYLVAGIGSAAVFVLLLILGRVRNENRILLVVRGARGSAADMEKLVFSYFSKKAYLRVRNTTAETVELIYELPRSVWQLNYKKDTDIADALYALGGVEYVNTVTQSDEISG